MRNKTEIYGKLAEARKFAKEARKEGNTVLISYYENQIKTLQGFLRDIKVFGSEVKPMRTPWKRLEGPRYFEEI